MIKKTDEHSIDEWTEEKSDIGTDQDKPTEKK